MLLFFLSRLTWPPRWLLEDCTMSGRVYGGSVVLPPLLLVVSSGRVLPLLSGPYRDVLNLV